MFDHCIKEKTVKLWIDELEIQYISTSLKALIVKYGGCSVCKSAISIDLRECECRIKRRRILITKVEQILQILPEDSKELRKAAKALLGYACSRHQLESELAKLLELSNHQSIHYGGSYEFAKENWAGIDELLKLDQRKKYQKTGSISRREHKSKSEGTYTKSDISAIWKLQEGRCYFCSAALGTPTEKHSFHIDHLIPLSSPLDSNEWPDNLALLCRHCNLTKHTKSEKEFWHICESIHGQDLIKAQKAKAKLNLPAKRKLSNARRKIVVNS